MFGFGEMASNEIDYWISNDLTHPFILNLLKKDLG